LTPLAARKKNKNSYGRFNHEARFLAESHFISTQAKYDPE
jgi:hypothetical protein